MRLVPKGKSEKISFFKQRIAKWAQDPQSLGLDAETMATLVALLEEAEAAQKDQRLARATARGATMRLDTALKKLSAKGGKAIQRVRASTNASGVSSYTAALIPPVLKRSKLPPPGPAKSIRHTLANDGSLRLKWTSENPVGATGTVYNVWRRIERPKGSAEFEMLGSVGEKRFDDHTVPLGSVVVTYCIHPIRPTCDGPKAYHTIQFGGGIQDDMIWPRKKLVAMSPHSKRPAA
jgi:hypothetical protein